MNADTLQPRKTETRERAVAAPAHCGAALVRAVGIIGWVATVAPLWAQEPESKPQAEAQADELGERLIRQAASGGDEDPMEAMLALMDEAATRLEIDFDAGPATQAVQDQVVEQLDKAIRTAAAHRRAARSRSSPFTGEKRTRKKGGQEKGSQPAEARGTADEPSGDAAAASSASAAATDREAKGALHEVRRTWGLLPQREREEIMQGSRESFLERYRDWIQRYYQALQEAPQ